MDDFEVKAPGGEPGPPPKPVIKPTQPGRPWAPPQEGTEGSDPTVPTAPAPQEPPQEPTDPLTPADPTMPVDLTTANPVLELPPEGMLRISKASEDDQFVFPVHAERWAEDGWTVHPPVTIDEGPAELLLVIPPPDEVLGGEAVTLLGTLPDQGTDPAPAEPKLAAPEPAGPVPDGSESVGLEPEPAPEVPAPSTDAEVAGPDFASMTKTQIVQCCEEDFGVLLDASQTKAVLVDEATRLWEESVTAPAEQPTAADAGLVPELDLSIPGDLLG
ncbi:hypothetical protein KBY93_12445 [Synechococcus sp. J7-Johnson]|uniref:hypothetical protein n=1 Tax=Synechococcus sp. J7-Johnson TaxID=2823737 RepID=UPI0020CC4DAD|nr:hypothetical protein [Synechococcus sp. J7-Johnson]MCP9841436.1 hypothetical protein [Synechococcus sp. J7-Johnson]